MGRDGEMARMARIFGLYRLVVVVCVHTVKYIFFDDVFMSCNSGFTCLRCYGIQYNSNQRHSHWCTHAASL